MRAGKILLTVMVAAAVASASTAAVVYSYGKSVEREDARLASIKKAEAEAKKREEQYRARIEEIFNEKYGEGGGRRFSVIYIKGNEIGLTDNFGIRFHAVRKNSTESGRSLTAAQILLEDNYVDKWHEANFDYGKCKKIKAIKAEVETGSALSVSLGDLSSILGQEDKADGLTALCKSIDNRLEPAYYTGEEKEGTQAFAISNSKGNWLSIDIKYSMSEPHFYCGETSMESGDEGQYIKTVAVKDMTKRGAGERIVNEIVARAKNIDLIAQTLNSELYRKAVRVDARGKQLNSKYQKRHSAMVESADKIVDECVANGSSGQFTGVRDITNEKELSKGETKAVEITDSTGKKFHIRLKQGKSDIGNGMIYSISSIEKHVPEIDEDKDWYERQGE